MATITWNGGNGDWSDGMHWTGGRPPGAGDDAVIATASTVTITHPAVARSVTLNNAGAQVTLSSVLTLSSAGPGLLLDAGSFALARQAILRTNGGAITLAGSGASLTTAGTVVLGSGVLAVGTGMLHLLDHGVVNGQITVAHGGSIVADAGSALQLDLATVVAAEQATGGAISIAAGAQFTVRTGNAGPISATQLVAELASAGQFSNAGKTSLLVTSSVTNDGATLQIGNAIGWTIAGAGRLSGGNIVLNGGTFDDAGTVALSGGNLTVNGGTLLDRGTVALTGGTLAVNGGTFLDSGKVLLASGASVVVGGGSFGGSGVVSGGSVALRGGKLVLAGLTLDRVAYSGALNLGNADQLTLARGTTVASPGGVIGISGTATLRTDAATTLAGTTVDLGGGQLAAAALSGSTVVNLSGGVAAIGTLAAGGVVNHTGPGGTLQGDGGTLNTAARINAGAAGGTLRLGGTVINSGSITVDKGDRLLVEDGLFVNASGGRIGILSGSLTVLASVAGQAAAFSNAAGGLVYVEGAGALTAYFGTNAGTIDFAPGAIATLGSTFFAGTTGAPGGGLNGGSINVDPASVLTVVTNVTETLTSFVADQRAIQADTGRAGFSLQIGSDLNLSPTDLLVIGPTGPTSNLVVNYSLVDAADAPKLGILGGNIFVASTGTLTLQNGNIYSVGSNTASLSMVGNGLVLATGLSQTIIGNVFDQSSAGLLVGSGSSLTIAGNFVLGNTQAAGGPVAGYVSVLSGASLTIYNNGYDSATAMGTFFLDSNSNLYLQNYADLKNQSVVFLKGSTGEVVHLQDAPVLGFSSLQGAFFGFGQTDQIVLPFQIGSLSYNGASGILAIADGSGHSSGAEFYVGSGYNGSLFGGGGSSTLVYNGAPPAALADTPHHIG